MGMKGLNAALGSYGTTTFGGGSGITPSYAAPTSNPMTWGGSSNTIGDYSGGTFMANGGGGNTAVGAGGGAAGGDGQIPGNSFMQGMQTVQGLGQLYLGMKQYGLAKDMFKQSKREFGLNWNGQAQANNTRMEDRQRARFASNPGAYAPTEEYMAKNKMALQTVA